jgi:hypothetical protein
MPRRMGNKSRQKKKAHTWIDGLSKDMRRVKVCGVTECVAQWQPGRAQPGSSCPVRGNGRRS